MAGNRDNYQRGAHTVRTDSRGSFLTCANGIGGSTCGAGGISVQRSVP